MSSNQLSTLCSGRSWQCEGYRIPCHATCHHGMERNRTERGPFKNKSIQRKKSSLKACVMPCLKKQYQSGLALDTLSRIWDVRRPVFHDKTFPNHQITGSAWADAILSEASNANNGLMPAS